MQEKILIFGSNEDALNRNINRQLKKLYDDKNGDSIVIDIQGRLHLHDAQKLTLFSDTTVNPLDFFCRDSQDLYEQEDFLFFMIETITGQFLTTQQKCSLDKLIIDLYHPYRSRLQGHINRNTIPTLLELYHALLADNETKLCALALEVYCKPLFCGHTNIDMGKHRNIYDMQEFGKDSQSLGTLIMLHQAFIQMQENYSNHKYTHLVLSSISGNLAKGWGDYLVCIYKRMRMLGGDILLSTTDIPFLLDTDTGRCIMTNSQKIGIMKQPEQYHKRLAELFNIGEERLRALKDDECLWI
jgi:hypothetical protein